MVFKAASIVQAPDGDPEKHRSRIKTGMFDMTTVVIKLFDVEQAVKVAMDLVENEGVQSLLLCPGFTHEMVAKIKEAVGENIPISVARGDVPSVMMTGQILQKEGWVPEHH